MHRCTPGLRVKVVVFNATFTNISVISWRSVLSMDETGVPGENHRPATGHWQTISHNIVSAHLVWAGLELIMLMVKGTDCIGSYKSNYHTNRTTTDSAVLYKYMKSHRKSGRSTMKLIIPEWPPEATFCLINTALLWLTFRSLSPCLSPFISDPTGCVQLVISLLII